VSFELEYLDKFEVKFETNLWYESGGLVSSFDEKNRDEKIHATVSLKGQSHQILDYILEPKNFM
jgi:hypothetical protein